MAARPTMMPSTPYLFLYLSAFSGLSMSPLPKTGMVMRLSLTAAISQSASLYISARVRPWMLMAWMPTSWRRSATSMYLLLSSQPRRV